MKPAPEREAASPTYADLRRRIADLEAALAVTATRARDQERGLAVLAALALLLGVAIGVMAVSS